MNDQPLKAVIIGAGHRAMTYASYAKAHPEQLSIVGVADLSELRRDQVRAEFDLPAERCYSSAEKLAEVTQFADIAINGTMDHQHVPTSLPLLEAGYHLLLEKPFATSTDEMWQLVDAAQRKKRHVSICHVLRYAPFMPPSASRSRTG
jgi:predicted dehydrogenase